MAEQLICNQQVVGSTPITSSKYRLERAGHMGDFPSGQRGQTVNLLSLTSVVRIHHPPPTKNALLSTDKGAFFEWCLPSANDVGYANDDGFALWCVASPHFMANIASLRPTGATSFWAKRNTSYRRGRCIIKNSRLNLDSFTKVWYNLFAKL